MGSSRFSFCVILVPAFGRPPFPLLRAATSPDTRVQGPARVPCRVFGQTDLCRFRAKHSTGCCRGRGGAGISPESPPPWHRWALLLGFPPSRAEPEFPLWSCRCQSADHPHTPKRQRICTQRVAVVRHQAALGPLLVTFCVDPLIPWRSSHITLIRHTESE